MLSRARDRELLPARDRRRGVRYSGDAMNEKEVPEFHCRRRQGIRGRIGKRRFEIIAVIDGVAKQVAITHFAETGVMVAEGLNQWRELAEKLKADRKGPRIVTL